MSKKDNEALCQRCGEEGEDRRTLKMACFYQMEELGLPFRKAEVFDIEKKNLKRTKRKRVAYSQSYEMGKGLGPKKRITYNEEIVRASGRVQPRQLYTLRTCKDCRADWMIAIQDWFRNHPGKQESCGSGIFVRRNGANVEISEQEWNSMHPDSQPARVKK